MRDTITPEVVELLYGLPKERVITETIATELVGLSQQEKDDAQIGCCGSYCSEAGCCPFKTEVQI